MFDRTLSCWLSVYSLAAGQVKKIKAFVIQDCSVVCFIVCVHSFLYSSRVPPDLFSKYVFQLLKELTLLGAFGG